MHQRRKYVAAEADTEKETELPPKKDDKVAEKEAPVEYYSTADPLSLIHI